jgi:hypothetical protein
MLAAAYPRYPWVKFRESLASSTGRCNTIKSADPQNAYPEELICLADVAKPSQGTVPADLTLASAFSFCFH